MSDRRLGMFIDLSLCIGCNACVVACKEENAVPLSKFNTWVESWDVEAQGRVRRANVPKQCNHCGDAPCITACPTGASYRAEDGTVQLDAQRCIGCKYCMAVCPYGARWVDDVTGVVGKCTFCHHRSSNGLLPACVSTCVTGARMFGDIADAASDTSVRMSELADVDAPADDLGLDPSLKYRGLAAIDAMRAVSGVHRGGKTVKTYEGRL